MQQNGNDNFFCAYRISWQNRHPDLPSKGDSYVCRYVTLCFKTGMLLTKATFVKQVREALVLLGKEPPPYAGHSFRIGAATAATRAGTEEIVIQSLGRWSSDAFQRYAK